MTTETLTESELRESNLALARQLMTTLGQPAFWDLLGDDFVLEFPYAYSLGEPTKHVGKADAAGYLKAMFARLDTFKFDNLVITPTTDPNVFFCEYEVNTTISTGEPYHQDYINKMRIKDGKVVSVREFWNLKVILDATGDGKTTI